MAATRFQLALITVLAALVVCAALVPARASATEESDDTADDGTITTVLQPGWNMVGWLGGDVPATEIFDQIPALVGVSAWDAEAGRYQRRTRTSVALHGLRSLTPGRGLWLLIGGDDPVEWTRPTSEDSMLLELLAGRNLVAWAGRDGTPIEEAVGRFGDALAKAWRWDAEVQRYLHYSPAGPEHPHPLRELNHGDALWVELRADARWWQSGTAPPPVEFLGEFTDEKRSEILGWVDAVRAVFAERWAVGAAPTIYVGDRESIVPTYRQIRGSEYPGYCGDSGGQVIFLRVSCVGEGSIAHEYFHALQRKLSDGYGAVPTWIIEGSAVYAAAVYTGLSDPTFGVRARLDEYKDREARRLIRYEVPSLGRIEGHTEFQALPDIIGYPLGLFAVDWLVERSSEESIIDFFEDLARSGRWQDAFEGAFGIAVEDFYDEFDAYLARIAPPLPHLTDTSDEPVLEFLGDLPPETRVAVRAEFDAVRNYFALELKAGTADYTLYVGGDLESLVDIYVRVSGTQPSSRVCVRLPYSGPAIINLDCHAALRRFENVHFIAVRELLAPARLVPPVQDGFDRRGPLWLRFGAELYVAYAYRAARGYEEGQASWEGRSYLARQTPKLLNSLSTWEGLNEGFSQGTALGFLAVEWLAERAGDTALFEYYRLLTESETWEEAFEAAFGIAVDDFYEAFEEYRAEVAPPAS